MSCEFYSAPPMVAYGFILPQQVDVSSVYTPEKGLMRGTIYPCLDKPLGVYGKEQVSCGGVKRV